jgi:tetratricopeptide (TPR) repeat protein
LIRPAQSVHSVLPNTSNDTAPKLVDGRYRVEAELGRGGMARVYRVIDERSDQRLALKRLLVTDDRGSMLRAMFEREYHTLVQLAHPHIVRVFEYGLDGGEPYYTMELLEGVDAREASQRASLSIRRTCLLLRDCASALALVHSRRMVHRDVGPRNLWCTPDNRGKLIDFGTLVAMGPQSRIAGTPPFVPPEALYAQPLDARCDLYALGALAYFMLTGHNAYPARQLAELSAAWQHKPDRPDALSPDVPRALSDLVMALLSLDARGRPVSASDVYERLTAIGELPVEDERHLAQSFLMSPTLVGRDEASAVIAKRLGRAVAGRGSILSIVGPSGFGRTRMLASLVLQAKLTGATTISVDALAVGSATLSLASTLAERLVGDLPLLAAAAMELGPVLGRLSPALHRAMGEPVLAELSAFERTNKLSSAIVALVELASRQQRLVIAVDDVHRADGASLGVLGRLSLLAADHHLLIATTCEAGGLVEPPPALYQLVNARHRVELTALAPEHTQQLLESLFGAVPGLDDAAAWMQELTAGNPQACMQYAQYLVDQGVARLEGGHWLLPPQLRKQGLPSTLGAMFERRIAALSDDARVLALGLALARDESRSSWQPETHVHLEDFPKLLQDGDSARVFVALDELLRAGIVQQRDSYYVLAQRALIDVLLRDTDETTRKRSHERLANIFTQPSYGSSWLAIQQLQRAGEHVRARQAIVAFANYTGEPDWGAMRVSLQARCSQVAVEHWQAEGGTPREGITLRGVLLVASTVYDWGLARFGEAQLAQLRSDCGLSYWDETDAPAPAMERIVECLKRAQQTYEQTQETQRGLPPIEALRELAACSMMLSRAYGGSQDARRTLSLLPTLAAVRALSAGLELVADGCKANSDRACARELGDAFMTLANRFVATTEISPVLRKAGAGLNLHEQALEDARLGSGRALQLIDLLAASGAGDDMFIVLHGRWLGNAFIGNASVAEGFHKRVEIITEDDVWRRRAYLDLEAELHALTGDLKSLTRTSQSIAELAQMFEGWRPWLAFTRATMQRLRGELAAAEQELDGALAQIQAGEHRAWPVLAAAHAELWLLLGDAEGAAREADAMGSLIRTHALRRSDVVTAERILARAHSQMQRHDAARAAMRRALELAHELGFGGLPLALLYETEAHVLLASGQEQECVTVLQRLWSLIEHAEAPALINAYESLREQSASQLASAGLPVASRSANPTTMESSTLYTSAQTLLTSLSQGQPRATQSLQLLLDESGAHGGHLLLLDANGLSVAASINAEHAGAELVQTAQDHLDDLLEDARTETQTATDNGMAPVLSNGRTGFATVLLSERSADRPTIVGIALLAVGELPLRVPRSELVRIICQCLLTAND